MAVLAAVGLFLVSDPESGYESSVWFLAPIMLLCSAAAALIGQLARRDGEEGGRWPAFFGFTIGGFFTLMLLIALVARLLGFE